MNYKHLSCVRSQNTEHATFNSSFHLAIQQMPTLAHSVACLARRSLHPIHTIHV